MRTNTSADINTDWAINQIVKPGHVNALTRSIKYDFVLTAQMLEGKTGDVEVFDVLGISIGAGTLVPGQTHILINTVVPDNIVLCFPGNQGGPSGNYHIHVHFLSGCKVNTSGSSAMIYFYFHSHGEKGAVEFTGIGRFTYVGSFKMDTPMALIQGSSFVYEMALGEVPYQPDNMASIGKEPWMSNSVGGGGSDSILRIFDTVAKKNQGLQYMRMVLGNDILAEVTGQDLKIGPRGSITGAYQTVPGLGYNHDRSAFIDMSEISGIDWTTWFTADMEGYRIWGNSRDYWDVTNPYTEMAIDTGSMVIGRVYAVKIHVVKNLHDTLDPYVTTHVNETPGGVKQLRCSQSQGGYAGEVRGSWPIWVSRGGWPVINGTISGGIALQKASGRWPNGDYPPGVGGTDLVMDITIGGITSTCVFSSNDDDEPTSSTTTTTIATTVHASANGEIYVEFSCNNRRGYARYYEIIIPPDYITGVSINTQFSIPTVKWKERIPITGDYEWQDREAFLLLAPLDGRPRFYSPYLLAQGNSGDYGWSYLIPKFHPVHSESRDMDTAGCSDPSYEEDYDPDIPAYEAAVYMCRIDDTHVLVLGY